MATPAKRARCSICELVGTRNCNLCNGGLPPPEREENNASPNFAEQTLEIIWKQEAAKLHWPVVAQALYKLTTTIWSEDWVTRLSANTVPERFAKHLLVTQVPELANCYLQSNRPTRQDKARRGLIALLKYAVVQLEQGNTIDC
jgi:hypothetical protein